MLPKLSQTESFKKEVKYFLDNIQKISDIKVQNSMLEDLKKLQKLSEEIDIGHSSAYNGMIKPSQLQDVRISMNKIRNNLKSRIEKFKQQ
jgi:hypothetical protein